MLSLALRATQGVVIIRVRAVHCDQSLHSRETGRHMSEYMTDQNGD
jgi:hypothetical protein